MLSGLALLGWAVAWWSDIGPAVVAPLMTLVCLVGGLTVIGVSVTSRSAAAWRRVDLRILVFTLIVTGMWLAVRSSTHQYQTDEITTGQASATVLLAGHNPYATDLSPQLKVFNLPPAVSTPLLGGGTVHTTSYPALSFLIYVPFAVLLGRGAPFAQVTDGFAWILLMVLLWRLLDERLRPIMPLIASFPYYLSFVDGGVTDVIFLPLLCLAFHRWDRFLDRDESRHMRWLGPVCLGLACSVKPTPWLIALFLVSAVTLEAARRGGSAWRIAVTYSAVALGTFALVNAAFIVMDPGAWTRGALLPLTQPLVPFGQGIAMLPLYLHIAGGHVGYLSVAGLAAVIASWGAFVAFYPGTARLVPLMAAAPLLISTRSLFNYFIYVAILILAHSSNVPCIRRSTYRGESAVRWIGRALTGGGSVVAVAAVFAFLASPPPLQLTVTGQQVAITAAGGVVPRITLIAVNRSDKPVRPTFLVTAGGWMNPAWRAESGPVNLPAHARATYVLLSTDPHVTIGPGTPYLVDAIAADPGSVSTSPWVTAP